MNKTVILIGIGEMGGVFARGILKAGYSVYPVMRGADIDKIAKEISEPEAVVVAVGEKDIQGILAAIPKVWHEKLVLLQNELLPRDWLAHKIQNPTVISAWFEKKAGKDVKVIISSPVFGPLAQIIKSSLDAINISCNILLKPDDLLFELVAKNVYILTVNIAGLEVGGTVGELWGKYQVFARDVAEDIMDIQFRLIEKELDRDKLIKSMVNAFNGDLDHKCMGRSAPTRLERAISQADQYGLKVNKLREIYKQKKQASV